MGLLTGDLPGLSRELARLGVDASEIVRPVVDAKKVREGTGLSQVEFARRFGLEARTVQNWEQNRNTLDPTATILLALIGSSPRIVEDVLARSSG